ncbi:MAG: SusC/RagA family TonB-linked outer membrane protein [Breznakibacter sp.]
MNRKNLLKVMFCLLVMLLGQYVVGQNKLIVSGKVVASDGSVIPGVNVLIQGTTSGTITDGDGLYRLELENGADAILEFSFIGYTSQQVKVAGKSNINIVLQEDAVSLDEVVAVGYGIRKKSDLTGAVNSVNAAAITETGKTSVLGSIQGMSPGVQIKSTSSRAGGSFDIQIRGKNSISGVSSPLYVVDGIITDNIDFLNPQDIEKIDILKDASSTAIYGSRGSNGVVIVQTKSGVSTKGKKTTINYNGYYGVSQVARMPEFMDSREWMNYRSLCYQDMTDKDKDGLPNFNYAGLKDVYMGQQKLNNDAASPYYLQPMDANGNWIGSSWLLNRYKENATTDWSDYVTQDGTQQNHYVDISGSTNDVSFVMGIGYQDEKGVFVNDQYTRYNMKGALDFKIDEKWSAGFNANMAYSEQELGSNSAIVNGFRMAPVTVPYDADGKLIEIPGKTTESGTTNYPNSIGGGGFTSSVNPILDLDENSYNIRRYTGMANFYLQVKPLRDLTLKTTFSPSFDFTREGSYVGSKADGNYGNNAKAKYDSYHRISYTWDNQINYSKTINNDHQFDVLGLMSAYSYNSELAKIDTEGYSYRYDYFNLGSASKINPSYSAYNRANLLSFAVRANYSYMGRYLLTASYRTDGSSKLADGNRWAAFPSVAAAWRISEEGFMQTQELVSNLKLRLSFGYTGNNNISPYTTQRLANVNTFYDFNGTLANGVNLGSLTNSSLTWEKTREVNLGVDFGFLRDRISGAVDVYDKQSEGLLQTRILPFESGAGSMIDNLGKVRNRGVEVALNTVNVRTSDLQWNTSFTFAANKNSIEELFGNSTDGYSYITADNKWIVGQPISAIYGYVFDGVWTAAEAQEALKYKQKEGEARIKDFDDNGIDPDDRRVQGHADPSWTGSFTSNLTYKGFDFSFTVYSQQGTLVYSPFIAEYTNYNDRGRQKLKMDYYVPAGARLIGEDGLFYTLQESINNQSRPTPYTNNGAISNCGPYWQQGKLTAKEMPGAWVDADFIKVRNITLGYTLPSKLVKRAGVERLRVYGNVLNPFAWTDYKGFDAEWADANINRDGGPATITYQFGVSLSF